jgi:hypothetical protein
MTAEIYTHIAENDVANSADKISDYFGSIINVGVY